MHTGEDKWQLNAGSGRQGDYLPAVWWSFLPPLEPAVGNFSINWYVTDQGFERIEQ